MTITHSKSPQLFPDYFLDYPESNLANFLHNLSVDYVYRPEAFLLPHQTGVVSFVPDFFLDNASVVDGEEGIWVDTLRHHPSGFQQELYEYFGNNIAPIVVVAGQIYSPDSLADRNIFHYGTDYFDTFFKKCRFCRKVVIDYKTRVCSCKSIFEDNGSFDTLLKNAYNIYHTQAAYRDESRGLHKEYRWDEKTMMLGSRRVSKAQYENTPSNIKEKMKNSK